MPELLLSAIPNTSDRGITLAFLDYLHNLKMDKFLSSGQFCFQQGYPFPPLKVNLLLPIGISAKPGSLEQGVRADQNGRLPLSLIPHPESFSFQLVAKRAITCQTCNPIVI